MNGPSLEDVLPPRDPPPCGALTREIEQLHASHILPVDLETARIRGEVTAGAAAVGRVVPAAEGLIAATAIRHGLHLMTRDTPDLRGRRCDAL